MSTDQPRFPIEPRRTKPVPAGGPGVLLPVALCLLAIALLALVFWKAGDKAVKFPTPYQAVLLNTGAVYYGTLDGYGTKNPVLTNVFYIVNRQDPNTKESSNMLVKRGKELHGPDRMYLNPNSIVFIETVSTSSKVAQLIQQANAQP